MAKCPHHNKRVMRTFHFTQNKVDNHITRYLRICVFNFVSTTRMVDAGHVLLNCVPFVGREHNPSLIRWAEHEVHGAK